MTSKSIGQVQVDLRLLRIADDLKSGLFLMPGTPRQITIFAKDETLGEWLTAKLGDNVPVRLPMNLAERMGLFNAPTVTNTRPANQKNG